jgi:hypothetical protein
MRSGVGAEAVTDDPFLRRRSLRSANTVKPIHAKAPAKTSITAGIVSMIQFRCGQNKCPARVIITAPHQPNNRCWPRPRPPRGAPPAALLVVPAVKVKVPSMACLFGRNPLGHCVFALRRTGLDGLGDLVDDDDGSVGPIGAGGGFHPDHGADRERRVVKGQADPCGTAPTTEPLAISVRRQILAKRVPKRCAAGPAGRSIDNGQIRILTVEGNV